MRILLFAYACEPGYGSEPGAGWAWARLLARIGDTWVVTRSNNRGPIEAELSRIPERERLHFVYVDLPEWSRRWKRGQRGLRPYYMLWQVVALRRARRLMAATPFELVWHVTMSTAWLGSTAALLDAPFGYGPIAGGARAPLRMYPALGVRGAAYEVLRGAARAAGRYLNPMARLAWGRARLILSQTEETRAWLPRRYRAKTTVLSHVAVDLPSSGAREGGPERRALFAGRLLEWKGGSLAVRAIAKLPDWTLLVAGSGPDKRRLRRLARRLNVEQRVRFLGRVTRDELLELMRREADVFLFPSLHDEAGWVVVEASSCGLPVVCLDVGGPPGLGGRAVAVSTPAGTAEALARAVREAAGGPPAPVAPFSLESREARLRELLGSAGLLAPASRTQMPARAR